VRVDGPNASSSVTEMAETSRKGPIRPAVDRPGDVLGWRVRGTQFRGAQCGGPEGS